VVAFIRYNAAEAIALQGLKKFHYLALNSSKL